MVKLLTIIKPTFTSIACVNQLDWEGRVWLWEAVGSCSARDTACSVRSLVNVGIHCNRLFCKQCISKMLLGVWISALAAVEKLASHFVCICVLLKSGSECAVVGCGSDEFYHSFTFTDVGCRSANMRSYRMLQQPEIVFK